jgi:guanylate kinase
MSSIDSVPLIIVISGPSGVGKDATIASLKQLGAKFHYIVTATTRSRRPNEVDGVDYYFLSKNDFMDKIKRGEFLEFAEVYGNYYGVLTAEVKAALEKGEDVILKVDVQGAETLKKKIPDAVFIFLMPPSVEELVKRLNGRSADSSTDIELRVNKAEDEMKKVNMFDYRVINYSNDLSRTAEIVKAIVTAEKCRVKQRRIKL